MLHKSWLELNSFCFSPTWCVGKAAQLSIMPRFLQRGHTMFFISLSGNARTPNISLEPRKNHLTSHLWGKFKISLQIKIEFSALMAKNQGSCRHSNIFFSIFSDVLFESPFVSFWLSSLWVLMKYHLLLQSQNWIHPTNQQILKFC